MNINVINLPAIILVQIFKKIVSVAFRFRASPERIVQRNYFTVGNTLSTGAICLFGGLTIRAVINCLSNKNLVTLIPRNLMRSRVGRARTSVPAGQIASTESEISGISEVSEALAESTVSSDSETQAPPAPVPPPAPAATAALAAPIIRPITKKQLKRLRRGARIPVNIKKPRIRRSGKI